MKKRKPPILLGAVLLIMLGVVLAVNASSLPSTESPDQQAAKTEDGSRPDTKAPDKFVDNTEKKGDNVHQSVLTPKPEKVTKGDAMTTVKKFDALKEGQPLIAAPREYKYKKENAGIAASGQWYTKESGVGKN
jgi:hypothetical protein